MQNFNIPTASTNRTTNPDPFGVGFNSSGKVQAQSMPLFPTFGHSSQSRFSSPPPRPPKIPQAQTKNQPYIGGTTLVPFQQSFVEDEQATFQTITAMEFYANKSPEELQMEDYQCKAGNLESKKRDAAPEPSQCSASKATLESKRDDFIPKPTQGSASKAATPATTPAAATTTTTNTYTSEPMECESLMDDDEIAMFLAEKFASAMANDLSSDEWKDLSSFVTPNWTTLRNQLAGLFFLRLQWKREGRSPQFALGYHYTTPVSLSAVRSHGLLTSADRRALQVPDPFMASILGDGIYTGNDPSRFYRFRMDATEGMMILRLVGRFGNVTTTFRAIQFRKNPLVL